MTVSDYLQIWFRDTHSLKYLNQKFKGWICDFWNQVDFCSSILFIIAICLRFTLDEEYFDWPRWLYSISFMVYFIRFSQVFYVVRQLGPKIIMIREMVSLYLYILNIMLGYSLTYKCSHHSDIYITFVWQIIYVLLLLKR